MNKESKNQPDLFARIRALKKLTTTQAKLVELFRNNQNSLAFETLIMLSAKAGVSKASTVRFLIHVLGYRDFAEFQAERQELMENRLESPIMRYLRASDDDPNGENPLIRHIPYTLQAIQHAYNHMDMDIFARIAQILAETERPLYFMGHRTSYGLVFMMYVNLQYIRPRVCMLGDAHSAFPPELLNVGKDDVVFIVSRRRYSRNSLKIAEELKNIGAQLILMTDSEVTPLSHLADIQLVVPQIEPAVFESNAAWTATLEALSLTVADKCRRKDPDYPAGTELILNQHFGFLEN